MGLGQHRFHTHLYYLYHLFKLSEQAIHVRR